MTYQECKRLTNGHLGSNYASRWSWWTTPNERLGSSLPYEAIFDVGRREAVIEAARLDSESSGLIKSEQPTNPDPGGH